MSTISKPYKHPNSGLYYFRRAVPKELRDRLGWEVKISLETYSLAEAKGLFNIEQAKCEELFILARKGNLPIRATNSRKQIVVGQDKPTLNVLLSRYIKERNPANSTIDTLNRAVRLFNDLYINVPAADITRPMMREYKSLLLKIPTNLTHSERVMSLIELVKNRKHRPTISSGSVNKYIKSISAVLSWSELNGYFDNKSNWSNPARGIKAKNGLRITRLPFEDKELERIFSSSVFSSHDRPEGGAGEASYWIPLIGLYTGARLEEIGQLLTTDIKQKEGVWYIDINNNASKRLKTKSSARCIPIHNELIDLGLIDYVNSLAVNRLFPLLRASKDGKLTRNWSKWFGAYLDKIGVTSKQKVYHSFRHRFKDALRSAGVDEAVGNALMGHAGVGTGANYGLGYQIDTLNKAIQSIEYEVLTIKLSL